MKRYLLLLSLLGVLLSSCCTSESLVTKDIEYITQWFHERDTVHVTDSVLIYAQGDTVYRDRWRTEWRERIVIKGDTIYLDKEVEKVVVEEKVPPWCWWILGFFLCIVMFTFIRWFVKLRRGGS